jgi:iron-sulfur cluster assembly protein
MSDHIIATIPDKPKLDESIHLTEKAAAEILRLREANSIPATHVLRIGVKGGGCSGFSYVLGFDAERKQGDIVMEEHGITVAVDPKSIFYLGGTTLDYSDGLNGKGFVFNNPNAARTCGCGSSFSA